MICNQCGAANDAEAVQCGKCGAALAGSDARGAAGNEPKDAAPALWNPSASVNWSLLFTPAFGAYLQMLNWQALGESGKAMWSRVWFYASLGMLGLYIYMSVSSGIPMADDKISHAISFSFLLAWYFLFGKTQSLHVKKKLGGRYAKKSWGKPLLVGAGGLVAYFAVAVVIGYLAGIVR